MPMLSSVDVEDAVESFFDTDCQILLLLSLRYNIYSSPNYLCLILRMITIHSKFTLDVRIMKFFVMHILQGAEVEG